VVVLDYGSGNLRSVARALRRVGADAEVTADPAAALAAAGLVVPGVGAFAACMAGLRAIGGPEIIAKRLASVAPVLGICVGMQVLFAAGDEHGRHAPGCGAWPGVVERLEAPVLPHTGWNTVCPPVGSRLFAGIDADDPFYFVHSYAVRSWPQRAESTQCWHGGTQRFPGTPRTPMARNPPQDPLLTWAVHGQRFVAAAEDWPLCATQFHPEKSGDVGVALLSNWLELIR
jgi:glutamine amidotransferase